MMCVDCAVCAVCAGKPRATCGGRPALSRHDSGRPAGSVPNEIRRYPLIELIRSVSAAAAAARSVPVGRFDADMGLSAAGERARAIGRHWSGAVPCDLVRMEPCWRWDVIICPSDAPAGDYRAGQLRLWCGTCEWRSPSGRLRELMASSRHPGDWRDVIAW